MILCKLMMQPEVGGPAGRGCLQHDGYCISWRLKDICSVELFLIFLIFFNFIIILYFFNSVLCLARVRCGWVGVGWK